MGEILRGARAYVETLIEATRRGWVDFFFRPADPTPLAAIRLLAGCMLLWEFLILGLDLSDTLGSAGWVDPGAVAEYLRIMRPGAWTFWTWVPDWLLRPAWMVCLGVALCFTVGLWSRWMAPLAWCIAVATTHRAPVFEFGFDQVLSMLLFYLAVTGASGQTISFDRLLGLRRAARRGEDASDHAPAPSVGANLGIRLIQVHLVIIYGMSGLSKLMSPEWWDGGALEMVLLTPEYGLLDSTGLLRYPKLLHFATHLTVALELSYPVLVWNRLLRPLILASVIALHVGIIASLGLVEFGLAMIIANLAFIPARLPRRGSRAEAPEPFEDGEARRIDDPPSRNVKRRFEADANSAAGRP